VQESIGAIDNGIGFTWQATAGISAKLSDRLNADLAWEYVSTPDAKWNSYNIDQTAYYGLAGPLTPPVGRFDGKFDTHMVMIGLRWSFGR